MGQAIAAAANAPEARQGVTASKVLGLMNQPGTISDGARDAANQILMEVAAASFKSNGQGFSWAQQVTEGNLAPKGTGVGSSSGTFIG